MAGVGRVDDLVKEYLLYRGLNNALKSLENDLKNDRDKGFRADRILEQLQAFIHAYDLNGLRDYWAYLDARIFCRLEQLYSSSVRKLEVSLLKYYLINALQNNKPDKLHEFFEKLTPELQQQSEWKDWFVLPFIKNPEENSQFAVYFNRQWQETFLVSLHNFLSVIFQSMPVPLLMNYEEDQRRIAKLREENETLVKQIQSGVNSGQMNIPGTHRHADLDISSPMASTPGASVDLMDDFFVISQDTTMQEREPQPKTNQIRSFIKNIGLPSSPIMGKKAVGGPSGVTPGNPITPSTLNIRKSAPGPQSGIKEEHSKANSSKDTQRLKSKSVSATTGATSTNAQPKARQSDEVEKKTDATPVSSALSKATKKDDSANNPELSRRDSLDTPQRTVPSSFPPAATRSLGDMVPTALSDEHSPFLLLGQEEYNEHRSPITQCHFSTSGNAVATADMDGVVKVWSLQPSPVTMATVMSKSTLLSIGWAAKSERLILLGNKAGDVRLFDTKDKKTVREASVDVTYPRVSCLRCHPAGSGFVCCSAGKLRTINDGITPGSQRAGRVSLWDLETMKSQRHLPLSPGPVAVNYVAYNSTGSLLVTGAADGAIRLYDLQSVECIASWAAHKGEVHTVQFSHDDVSCYSMGSDGKFLQWSIHKPGRKLSSLPIHSGACGPFMLQGAGGYRPQVLTPKGSLFSLSPDGHHVLSCSQNGGLVYRFDADNGLQKALSLGGHRAPVTSVDWCPAMDGKMCLSGSMDGCVRLSSLLAK